MALALDDLWVWDSWVADDGHTYHLFFLQAPKSLIDPGRRHAGAAVGHATSTDLLSWTYHGTVLGPAEPGAWDDLSVWTGSTVRGDDGVWRMFYTGVTAGPHGPYEQRVGLAESTDLRHWQRVGSGPLLSADPRWYQTFGDPADPGASETWRDPFVFRDPAGDGWHMYVTARQPGADRFDDGILAHARSADLIHWELGPPVSTPAQFGQLEVPQVRLMADEPVLVFTCHPDEQDPRRRRRGPAACTWSVTGPTVAGPWDIRSAAPFLAEPDLFAAPLVQTRAGEWVFLGFVNLEPKGVNAFEIIDPIPVSRRGHQLTVDPGYESVGAARLVDELGPAARP